jgi:xylulokinase
MIVAVDCGSTNMKAALYGSEGNRMAEASRPLPYTIQTRTRVELSPEAVWGCFLDLIHDLCGKTAVTHREIRRIAFTSQAQTFTTVDPEGKAVTPFIGWADVRAQEEAKELQTLLGKDFHRLSGSPALSPMHVTSKVLWMRRGHSLNSTMRIVSLPSFLAMLLGAVHATDRNLAAMTGLYSISEKQWSSKMMEAAGVETRQLGILVEPGAVLEKTDIRRCRDFSPDLDIVMACNDHTAGAVGCGCRQGHPTLTLGTAGVLYRYAGERPGPFSRSGLWGPYPLGGYYELLCLNHACSALDWADQFLHGSVDSPRFAGSARKAQTNENSPLFYPDAQGSADAWLGNGTVEQRAYSVLEGIGFALRHLAGENFYAEGEPIMVLGGGSRLDHWVQIAANIFEHTMVCASGDGLDGAAQLAGAPIPSARESLRPRSFLPDPSKRDLLALRYRRWLSQYRPSSPATPA